MFVESVQITLGKKKKMKVKIYGHIDAVNNSDKVHDVMPARGGYWLKAVDKKGNILFYISPECPVVELKRNK